MKRMILVAMLLFVTCQISWGQSSVPFYSITTVAGTYPLGDGGPATAALLFRPSDIASDGAGNLYIADTNNHRIRKVASDGSITTVAGTGVFGFAGDRGSATAARLNAPTGVVVGNLGNLYIADTNNHRIRKITSDGVITTFAGTGTAGFLGDGGPATSAQLNFPRALAFDSLANLYIADTSNHRIRKVAPDGSITTVAGTGTAGFSGDGGPATSAWLNSPQGVARDGLGALFIADTNNHRIRKVTPDGVINTFAGTGTAGFSGDNGPASLAQLDTPVRLAVDNIGDVFVEVAGPRIRRVTLDGVIRTFAGSGTFGFSGDNGPATAAQLDSANGVAVDAAGNVYIADTLNERIREVKSAVINTVAGASHYGGDGGPSTSALLFAPLGLANDSTGNLYVADGENHRIRKITPSLGISTVAGTGARGFAGDAGDAFSARLNFPAGLALDGSGNVYIADSFNSRIRKVTAAGVISTVAGTGALGFSGDGGPATSAQLNLPEAVVADGSGNLYIADTNNHRIRKVTPTGVISTVAGTGQSGFSGDGGPATSAQLFSPYGVAVDGAGNLYIADTFNSRVRKVTPAGVISTVAGTGVFGFSGDGGPANAAALSGPVGLALEASGNLYIVDQFNLRVRVVTPAGVINTIAGSGDRGFTGDGGLAIQAALNDPWGVAVDSAGNIYITDSINHRIRKLTPLAATRLTVVSGDRQAEAVNRILTNPLVVRVTTSGGLNLPGATVTFAVTAGSAKLSSTTAVTSLQGTASVSVTLGDTAGTVTISAAVSGLPAVTFTLTATVGTGGGTLSPSIAPGGVVGGGLSIPPVGQISPNAIISIFGSGFAAPGSSRLVGSGDLVNGRLPTKLGGVCVQIGTQFAPIFQVFPSQLNVQVPSLAGSGDVTVQVIVNCGEANESKGNIQTVTLQAATPEFFFAVGRPDGKSPVAAVNAVTGASIGAPGLLPGATFVPAKPSDFVTIFATGFGATTPSFAAGQLPDSAATTIAPVTVRLGGVELSSENVLYAGVTSFAGLYQLNIRVPADAPDGDLPVTVQVGDFSTPAGGFLTVRR